MSVRGPVSSAIAVTSIAMLAGCSSSASTYGTAHAPVAIASQSQSGGSFPGHACIANDKLTAETWVVTPAATQYDSTAQNVCQQLFGSPKAFASASALPNGYVLRCTGTGYGVITRIYALSDANEDCQELAKVGYKVVES
jgi:hypothetical protein